MTSPVHRLVRDFFAALPAGTAANCLADDLQAWTTTSPQSASRERYLGGIALLQSIFDGELHYTIDSITAEADRAAAEVQSHGKLIAGLVFCNRYVLFSVSKAAGSSI